MAEMTSWREKVRFGFTTGGLTGAKLALAALGVTLAAASASAEPHPMYLPGHQPARIQAKGNELYYGGPVISQVKVVAVMWGAGVNAGVQAGIAGFFTAATNSTWFDTMAQFATNLKGVNGHKGTNQTIGRGTFESLVTIKPHDKSTNLSNKAVQKELVKQIDAHILPTADANTVYMIYFPPGITITLGGLQSCSSFGAYHEGFTSAKDGSVFYGVMPDCGFSFSDFTSVSSHELAEATTDAFPTPGSHPHYPQAWNTSDGYEIGDLCEGLDGTLQAGSTSYTVQQLYSNTIANCTSGNYTSP